jgi:KaiC/GvpD/RAD55 family RecA-like ATPase
MPTDKKGVEPMPKEAKERKTRSANRKLEELTLNEQRTKLLKQLAKFKGIISRNKARYEAITPHKLSKNKDLEQTKADYKKSYEEAETKRVEVSTQLKEIEKNIHIKSKSRLLKRL